MFPPHLLVDSLVTPRISGLNLSDSIRAMRDAGIDVAVGDNSRLDLMVCIYMCVCICVDVRICLNGERNKMSFKCDYESGCVGLD